MLGLRALRHTWMQQNLLRCTIYFGKSFNNETATNEGENGEKIPKQSRLISVYIVRQHEIKEDFKDSPSHDVQDALS